MAFFRPAPRRRCPALTSGPNYTKLYFLCFLQAIPPESSVGNGKTPLLAHWHDFGGFCRFFGRLQDDAALRLPMDRIALNSVSWAFAGHFTRIGCWKRKYTSISRLPQFCSLEQLLAFFRPTLRRRCPALTSGPNYTKLYFLCFLQAIPPESSVENGKTPSLADWHGFVGFLSVFRPAPRRRCPSLTPGPNCTKLGFLGFCRPFHQNWVLEAEKYQY